MAEVPIVSIRLPRLNDTPLPPAKTVPAPTLAATASSIAGPTAREPCCIASFNATALGSRSRSTRLGASDCAPVCCVARSVPLMTASATTYQGLLTPSITSSAITEACASCSPYTHCNSRLRVTRSARYPINGVAKKRGDIAAKVISPTQAPQLPCNSGMP